jgi:formylglycine-generating enzyme required for sulfatase activity
MNMKRVFGVMILAAVLIVGCDFILGPDEPIGGGNLVIGFGEGGGAGPASVSRGVVPTAGEQAELRYELALTGPENQSITVSLTPGQTFNQQVALGEWHIYAKAYNPEEVLIGTGTAAATVRAGNNEARVWMEPTRIPGGTQSTRTISGVSVPFHYVPAGSFQRDNAAENISVIASGYWMGETEVTQELFKAVMGNNPSNVISNPEDPDAADGWKKLPVETVCWYHAIAFCNKLSLADEKEPVYAVNGVNDWAALLYSAIPTTDDADWNAAAMDTVKNGYRLPTEMEWMWAAMGADTTIQPNTEGYTKAFAGSNGNNSLEDYAWFPINSGNKPHEVGKKLANELGLYDMSGNVSEWCWDWYDNYPAGEQTNFDGTASGTKRVERGGCHYNGDAACAVSKRSSLNPDVCNYGLGFRVVCP